MEDTLTGRRLLAEGERRLVVRLLQARLGEGATPYLQRLELATEGQLLAIGDLIGSSGPNDEGFLPALEQILSVGL